MILTWNGVVLFILMLTCGAFLASARLALVGVAKIEEKRHLAGPLSVFAVARNALSTNETLWQIDEQSFRKRFIRLA